MGNGGGAGAPHSGCELSAALEPYLRSGDRLIKAAHCKAYYSAVLLASGTLLVVASENTQKSNDPMQAALHAANTEEVQNAVGAGSARGSFSDSRRRGEPQHQHRYNVTRLPSDDEAVLDVAAGESHIVYCTVTGAVFSCGYRNEFGQLGDGTVWTELEGGEDNASSDDTATPLRIPRLSPARRIHGFGGPEDDDVQALSPADKEPKDSAAVVAAGASAGAAVGGELCTTKRSYLATVPALAAKPVARTVVRIRAVSCGAAHSLLLTKRDNCVYACGFGEAGQLGARSPPVLQPTFRAIRLLFGLPIKQILAAGNHSFVLLHTGKLLAFGENACGQLGTGDTKRAIEPTPVHFSFGGDGSAVSADGSSAAADGDGELMWRKGILTFPDGTRVRRTAGRHGGLFPKEHHFLLDAKTYSSLRAPYASIESTHFPLRSRRLDGELEPRQPFVLSVWGCASNTVVLTGDLEWLSCGLSLTRSWRRTPESRARYDGYGGLGRPLKSLKEGYRFSPMAWTPMLRTALMAMTIASSFGASSQNAKGKALLEDGAAGEGDGHGGPESFVTPLVDCFSYPHVTYVRLTCPVREEQTALTSLVQQASEGDRTATPPGSGERQKGEGKAFRTVLLEVGCAAVHGEGVPTNCTGLGASSCGSPSTLLSIGEAPSATSGGQPGNEDDHSGEGSAEGEADVIPRMAATTASVLSGLGLESLGGASLPTERGSGTHNVGVHDDEASEEGNGDYESFQLYLIRSQEKVAVPLRDSVMVM